MAPSNVWLQLARECVAMMDRGDHVGINAFGKATIRFLLATRDELAAEVERLRAENADLRKTAPRKGRSVLVIKTDNVAAVRRLEQALTDAGVLDEPAP